MSFANLPAPTFDLEAWSSNYSGPLLPLRLAHVAANCPPLSHQALTSALDIAKSGKDVGVYERLTELASMLGHRDLAARDADWVPRQEDANKRELGRLEQELKGYKNNLIRESIRMGQEDLALHLLLTGGPAPAPTPEGEQPQSQAAVGLNAAYGAFGKMRDFCTTPTHIASMTLRLQLTAAVQAVTALQANGSATSHFNNLLSSSTRLRSVGVKDEEQTRLTPLASAGIGISYLGIGQYKDAANAFLAIPLPPMLEGPILGSSFTSEVATPNDIAIYGGLTALATLSRDDLKTRVLDSTFRAFLELEPHMRKAISLFTTAKYRACLDTLQRYYADWSLDVFLGGGLPGSPGTHVDSLFARIREKSLVAHFSSFSQISLSSLASTFPPTSLPATASPADQARALESEVIPLIQSGALTARLDAVNGLLTCPPVDIRERTHADAASTADEIERTLLARLHRVNVTLAGLEIPGAGKKGGADGWASAGGGGGGYRVGQTY